MPSLPMLPVLLRERWAPRTLPREPEPDLIMDGEEQVAAFVEAGRIDGVMAAAYLFNSAHISAAIQGCKTVVDLGCGPATQLAQVAELNPGTEFIGVDMSPAMLASAEKHVRRLGLPNVRFLEADVTNVAALADGSVDGVMSTLALHHLPTFDNLRQCFSEVRRIVRPGGAACIIDLGRLKSLKSVLFFAYMNAPHQPHLFSLDYERSLRAAFLREDFKRAIDEHMPDFGVRVYSTLQIEVLIMCSTATKALSPALAQKLRSMRRALKRRYRRDLDDIRLFFRLAGLKNDPFR